MSITNLDQWKMEKLIDLSMSFDDVWNKIMWVKIRKDCKHCIVEEYCDLVGEEWSKKRRYEHCREVFRIWAFGVPNIDDHLKKRD